MSKKRNKKDIASSDNEDADGNDDSNSSKRRRQVATQDSLLENGDGSENEMDLDQLEDDGEEYQEEEPQSKKSKLNGKSKGKGKESKRDEEDELDEEVDTDDDNVEEDEEENDELASEEENIKEEIEANRKSTGAIAESGVIEKVELTNFMCHKRQTVRFGPQLNFLIGHNGSGKSAFLTAITVALGGKASSTSRGHSFRTFVREGCTSAEVILTLRNKGEEAFRHEIYGDRIIIERRINADGGGNWKIKSSEGKTISTKKEELNALTDHCNIQVDNPLNVLSQDAARSFLSSSKADDKYKFFLSGTQLTQLANEYETVSNVIQKIKKGLDKQAELLPELEEKKQEAVQKYKLAQKAREQLLKLENINKLLVWSQVGEKEDELRKKIVGLEQTKEKLEKHQEQFATAEAMLRQADEQITENESLRDGAEDRTAPLKSQRVQAIQQLKQLNLKNKNVHEEEVALNDQYHTLKERIRDFDYQIEEESRKRIEGDRLKQAKRDRYEEDKDRLTSEISALKLEFAEIADQIKSVGLELDQAVEKEKSVNQNLDEVRNQLSSQQAQLNQLNKASGNRLYVYGQNIPQLIQMINEERRWNQKPIGPIGLYVKVKAPEWTQVLENVIGNTLNAFCVTTHQDRALLQQLIRRSNNSRSTSIITAKDDNFDYSHGEPDESILTMLRVLDIQNEYVKRQLITASHIETNALIETRAAATELVRKNIRNVKFCYTKDNMSVSGSSTSTSAQTLNQYKGPSRLSQDTSAQVTATKQRIEALSREVQSITNESRRCTTERQGLERALSQHKKRQPELQRQIRNIQNQCAALEDDMNEDAPENVSAIEAAKRDAEEELNGLASKFTSIQSRKEITFNEVQPLKDKIELLKQQIEAIEASYSSVTTIIERAVEGRINAQQKKSFHETRVGNLIPEVQQRTADVDETEAELDTWTQQALEYCEGERLETRQSHAEILREKAALEKSQNQNRKRGQDNLEAIVADMTAFAKRHDDAKKEFDDMYGLKDVQTEDPNTTHSKKEAIGCPIRCLDEFDVFMDAVNRKIAMDMMISNAKSSNATQYILITPQGMQSHEGTEGVYITKMNDPVRNQATLN